MIAEEKCLAVVGSRAASAYGKETALELAKGASENGLTVVSGLAFGIDYFAHQAAVDAGKRTVAVLGGGLDRRSFYPKQNLGLAEKILENGGALVSEYAPGTEPANYTFPRRNRIISGLALGILVVEAKIKSGALLTAAWAKKQNKKIFAIPGPIRSANSQGCNLLIKNGAQLTENINDILKGLNIAGQGTLPKLFSSSGDPKESLVLKVLEEKSLNIEKIIEATKLDAAAVAQTLVSMELEGKISDLGGNNYGINR
jgi:DNA processing protein